MLLYSAYTCAACGKAVRRYPAHRAYSRVLRLSPADAFPSGGMVEHMCMYVASTGSCPSLHLEAARAASMSACWASSGSRGQEHISLPCLLQLAVLATSGSCARSFYVRVLGFQRQPRPPFPFGGAWLTGGGLTLHLIDDDPTIPHALGDWRVGPPRVGLYPNA